MVQSLGMLKKVFLLPEVLPLELYHPRPESASHARTSKVLNPICNATRKDNFSASGWWNGWLGVIHRQRARGTCNHVRSRQPFNLASGCQPVQRPEQTISHKLSSIPEISLQDAGLKYVCRVPASCTQALDAVRASLGIREDGKALTGWLWSPPAG